MGCNKDMQRVEEALTDLGGRIKKLECREMPADRPLQDILNRIGRWRRTARRRHHGAELQHGRRFTS